MDRGSEQVRMLAGWPEGVADPACISIDATRDRELLLLPLDKHNPALPPSALNGNTSLVDGATANCAVGAKHPFHAAVLAGHHDWPRSYRLARRRLLIRTSGSPSEPKPTTVPRPL